jgi:hypothetical protein
MTFDLLINPEYWHDRAEELRRVVPMQRPSGCWKPSPLTMSSWRVGRRNDCMEAVRTTPIRMRQKLEIKAFTGILFDRGLACVNFARGV